MSHKTRSTIIAAAALLLILSSLACSIGGEEATTAPTVPPATEPPQPTEPPAEPTLPPATEPVQPTEPPAADTPAPAATETVPAAPPAEIPPGEEPLDGAEIPELEAPTLDPRAEGLGHLGSFRQRMTINFTGEDTGYTGVYHYDAEVNTADQAVHFTISIEGAAAQELPANQMQAIWIGAQLWFKVGNLPWIPVPESVAEAQFEEQMFSAGDFMPYVPYFQRVEPDETVNGIPSAHYTYDAQDLPTQYGSVDGRGDVYVALDGGYVVRYTLEGSGTFEDYFQGAGTINLVYDTYDVGAPIDIQPPGR